MAMHSVIEINPPVEPVFGFFLDLEQSIVRTDPKVESVVKVTTLSQSCQRGQEGTGWVLSPGQIVTNAHVVAGADEVQVEGGDETQESGHPHVFQCHSSQSR